MTNRGTSNRRARSLSKMRRPFSVASTRPSVIPRLHFSAVGLELRRQGIGRHQDQRAEIVRLPIVDRTFIYTDVKDERLPLVDRRKFKLFDDVAVDQDVGEFVCQGVAIVVGP